MDELTSERIISLLEEPTDNRIPVYRKIRRYATVRNLIAALEEASTPLIRQNLCDILGERHAKRAVQVLIRMLKDPCSGVRSSAADALAKIGKVSAGPAVLEALQIEEFDGVRQMLVLALGAIGYATAIPSLLDLLDDASPKVRGCAAWSLGALNVERARQSLRQALELETDSFAQTRMREAIRIIA